MFNATQSNLFEHANFWENTQIMHKNWLECSTKLMEINQNYIQLTTSADSKQIGEMNTKYMQEVTATITEFAMKMHERLFYKNGH